MISLAGWEWVSEGLFWAGNGTILGSALKFWFNVDLSDWAGEDKGWVRPWAVLCGRLSGMNASFAEAEKPIDKVANVAREKVMRVIVVSSLSPGVRCRPHNM